MKQTPRDDKTDRKKCQSLSSDNEEGTGTAGQAAAGTDRAEVDSDDAHRAHHAGDGAASGDAKSVTPSEEAKNQAATSKQSRALSGTTAPRKV
jgi:hypothetical protein